MKNNSKDNPKRRKWLINISIILVSLVAGLAIAEIGLRLFFC